MQVNASKGIGKGNNSFNLQELSEPKGIKYTLIVFSFLLIMFLKKMSKMKIGCLTWCCEKYGIKGQTEGDIFFWLNTL